MTGTTEPGGIAADRLRSIIERVERLEEEKRSIAEDIKQVKLEARAAGFDVATINAIIKERRMDDAERREKAELLELYRAALGMLDGTPLGEAAKARLMKPVAPRPPRGEAPGEAADAPPLPDLDPLPRRTALPTAEEVLSARAQGAAAAVAGKPVTANPHAAGDPRRAAWDEGWCGAAGGDGMDIPAAFKRATPKKPKGEGKGTGA